MRNWAIERTIFYKNWFTQSSSVSRNFNYRQDGIVDARCKRGCFPIKLAPTWVLSYVVETQTYQRNGRETMFGDVLNIVQHKIMGKNESRKSTKI